ncbi:MAG: hypothetical protein R2684_14035 [Pyrinomonadaceae bacterium]
MFKKSIGLGLLSLAILLLQAIETQAQHCPFDGSEAVVIHVTDSTGTPISNLEGKIRLVELGKASQPAEEVETAQKETGTAKPFNPKLFSEPYDAFSWSGNKLEKRATFERLCADCVYDGVGYYAARMTFSDKYVDLKTRDFKVRDLAVEIAVDGDVIQTPIAATDIYSLCTGTGKWSRIVPVEIVINPPAKTKETSNT